MDVQNHIYTYQDAMDGIQVPNVPSSFDCLDEDRLKAFLSNPSLSDTKMPMLVYTTVDGNVVGWLMLFPTKLSLDGDLYDAMSASDFHVLKEYQHKALGVDLAVFPINEGENGYLLYAGPSPMALKLYKRMKFKVFSMPYIERKQKYSLVKGDGLSGKGRNFVLSLANFGLGLTHRADSLLSKLKGFEVRKLGQVPEWIDDMMKKDGHRFSEVHDRKWLQWSLENRYHREKENKQAFFGIYKKDVPYGFALTTERLRFGKVHGFVAEWGSIDSKLTEELVYRLVLPTFSERVERVGLALNDVHIVKSFKKLGFRRKNDYTIVFRDQKHQIEGVQDANNWRLRYGYADVILSS